MTKSNPILSGTELPPPPTGGSGGTLGCSGTHPHLFESVIRPWRVSDPKREDSSEAPCWGLRLWELSGSKSSEPKRS